jgi:hypothetical protein
MGLPPSGKIVARPMLTRACGHVQEFQHYQVDKYRAQRQAKFVSTRCADCVAQLQQVQRGAAPLPKGEAMRLLPSGTQVSLTLQEDGSWRGVLNAGGETVELAGAPGAGPQSVVVALARLWITATTRAAPAEDMPPG